MNAWTRDKGKDGMHQPRHKSTNLKTPKRDRNTHRPVSVGGNFGARPTHETRKFCAGICTPQHHDVVVMMAVLKSCGVFSVA